ncbi:MAG TPA: HAMP domain-containing sensor histidine kinase [Chloroflexota bacterium]|nr:HAMP domain-containing sensor histidine kinase [Chloroflexota bacterium]
MSRRALAASAAVVATALIAALVYARAGMGAPPSDVQALAIFLLASGAGSYVIGAFAVGWLGPRLPSLRLRLLVAYGSGLVVVLAVVAATSVLMFLSGHDLSLLLLLLAFATVVSLAFGYSVASGLTDEIAALTRTSQRLAQGDWGARVATSGSDELAQLGAAFDRMASQLQQMFQRERDLETARRDLIAGVSHDLRTPLATAQAMVESILDGVVAEPSEVTRFLRLIRADVLLLSRLIDDLFELSQIEVGALHLDIEPTALPQLIIDTIEAYRAQAGERGIAFEWAVDPSLPLVAADPPRLQRVLRNLLDNAQRYTGSGGSVRVEAQPDGTSARITVADTGPGLPTEDAQRVFDRFYQGEGPTSRQEGAAKHRGAGLGLAIARGLVEAHGGRIWVEPRDPVGTSFHFLIPLAT